MIVSLDFATYIACGLVVSAALYFGRPANIGCITIIVADGQLSVHHESSFVSTISYHIISYHKNI